MDYPPVTIVMTTYFPSGHPERISTALRTIETWENRLIYSLGDLYLHIADDGSPCDETNPHHVMRLVAEHGTRFQGHSNTYSYQNRHGVGASLNRGFKAAFDRSPIVIYAVDDWSITDESFDITPWVKLLLEREDIGMVRLGPPHPGTSGTIEAFTDDWQGWGLRLDRHHFAFGHRPALYHKRMIDYYGWFAEDCDAMVCEKKYNAKFCQDPNGPDIVLALPHPWYHIDSVELGFMVPGEDNG